ncbi:MAG: PRC-barrel domain-containing protein [Pseudomonadota bacterium]
MLYSLNDILKYNVDLGDARGSVEDILFEAEEGRVCFVAIDIGGWFDSRSAVLSAERVAEIDADARTISVDVAKQEIEAAPEIGAAGQGGAFQPAGDWTAWPKVMVGPSASAIARDLVSFIGFDPAGEDAEPRGGKDDDIATAAGLTAVSTIVSTTAIGSEGEIGRVIDLLFDDDSLLLSHLVVDTGTVLPERQMVVPIKLLSHFAEEDGHTVLRTTKDAVEKSPPLEEFDGLERNWLDAVAAYYGLS